ncbi:MarR family winged helix-turn-helix transcriptional regulator [Mycobacteroides immunogenum]|uniref:MarR family winged helix-turn-helix transcriptional regulator n=1 Tax=Mycobacteroides immunogenum TaxID=83262 RepID=UPI000ADE9CD9|nr:helix-turn-helix domain-containing protein [Mycobacteroides immunogenum]
MKAEAREHPDDGPPRQDWPELPARTSGGDLLSEIVLATFRLNARFLDAAQQLAANGGITAAWWQVLGGILDGPRAVPDIARRMGMTRQGVLRVADLLVEKGLAEYRTNPDHRRAKVLACTQAGYWAVHRIALVQHPWADRIAEAIDDHQLADALTTLRRLIERIEASAL